MAYTKQDWEVVKAFFESGLSLNQIVARPEVVITDKSSISKKAKAEGWLKAINQPLVEKEIQLKQELNEVNEQKSTLNSTELEVHKTLVDERTKDLVFFRNASLLISQTAIKKVQSENLDMKELDLAQGIIAKGKETIYGKSPDFALQVNNQVNTVPTVTTDEFEAIAKRLLDR